MASLNVLYVDRSGHPSPLSHCFQATGSKDITSSLNPSNIRAEVDSAFCPYTLSFHDAASAARLMHSTSSRQCPKCHSHLSLFEKEGKVFFTCGGCDYSTENFLSVAASTKTAEVLTQMAEKLGKLEVSSARSGQFLAAEKITEPKRLNSTTSQQDAHSIARKAAIDTIKVERISIDDSLPSEFDSSLKGISTTMLQLQGDYDTPVTSGENLLPLRVPLRLRRALRCRQELGKGRPGILVKPKLSPLEGDSSMRTGHGQWFKKVRITTVV